MITLGQRQGAPYKIQDFPAKDKLQEPYADNYKFKWKFKACMTKKTNVITVSRAKLGGVYALLEK